MMSRKEVLQKKYFLWTLQKYNVFIDTTELNFYMGLQPLRPSYAIPRTYIRFVHFKRDPI